MLTKDNHRDHVRSVWRHLQRRIQKQADKLGYSINDIIVIASVIERECQVDEERGKVASVIYNRLKEEMPLQMCSTVQYVLGKQKETLTNADTEYLHLTTLISMRDFLQDQSAVQD